MKSIPYGIRLNVMKVTKSKMKKIIKKFKYIPFVGGNRPLPDLLEWDPEPGPEKEEDDT